MRVEKLWHLSSRLYAAGHELRARSVQGLIFVLYRALLPAEVAVPADVGFFHQGLGTVIHPNTVIGRNVRIGHNVTITAGGSEPGSPLCVVVEDDVTIGSGALVKPPYGGSIRIGKGALVAAHAIVFADVPPGAKVVPEPSPVQPPADDARVPLVATPATDAAAAEREVMG